MKGFKTWFEVNLFGMPMGNDHTAQLAAYDTAWERDDEDGNQAKDQWIQFVRNTATKYRNKLNAIINQLHWSIESGNTPQSFKSFGKELYGSVPTIRWCHLFLTNVSNTLGNIIYYHHDVDSQNLSDMLVYQKHNAGFGVDKTWADTNKSSVGYTKCKENFKPNIMSLVDEVVDWLNMIVHRGHDARPDLHKHLFRHYENQEHNFAHYAITTKDEIKSKLQKHDLDHMKNHIDFIQSMNSLLDLPVWQLLHEKVFNSSPWIGANNNKKNFTERDLEVISSFADKLDTFKRNNDTNYDERIQEYASEMWNIKRNIRGLMVALNVKFGKIG